MSRFPLVSRAPGKVPDQVPDQVEQGPDQLRALARGLRRSLLGSSFLDFVKAMWPVVEPHRPFVLTLATAALIEHLQALHDGRLSRLACSIAPGSGKSTLASVLFPAWQWLTRPQARSIYASHALDLARRDSQRTRRLITDPRYLDLVDGAWSLRSDANRLDLFENTSSGHRVSIGVGGALTGLRAGAGGVIVVDDSLNAIDSRSKSARDAVNDWFDAAVSTRLDAARAGSPGGGIALIQQRLHSRDLIGHALELGGFESLVLASEFDPARRCVTSIWTDPRAESGELLAPEIHSAAYLAEQKRILGSAAYACQYLANPSDDEGGLFLRSNWRFWKPDGTAPVSTRRPSGCTDVAAVPLPSGGRTMVSLDAAFKDLSTSDAVCFLVARVVGAERYLLERRYGRMSFTRTCDVLRELAATHAGATFLIEDKANGSAILDACRKIVPNLVAINPKESKEARAAAISPAVEAHQVFLPEGAAWLDEFISECAAFPKGAHDDQVDSLSQLLAYAVRQERATPDPQGGWSGDAHGNLYGPGGVTFHGAFASHRRNW